MAEKRKIVIVGSGVGGITFAEKYRSLESNAEITLITGEKYGYYSRPLLSRGFTKADIEQTIILKSFDKLREVDIDILAESLVSNVDRIKKTLDVESQGKTISLAYDILVLAMGSAAFVPPPFLPFQELFFSLNSLADLKAIRKFRQLFLDQQQTPRWAVIGGGLIGCEVASDLAVAGDQVTVYHAMDRLMERQLVEQDSAKLLGVLQASGVNIKLNQNVRGFAKAGDKVTVQAEMEGDFDGLIVACGFKPRTELAKQAGLEIGRGIKVNSFLQANDESIFALGDVAEMPSGKIYAYILPIRNQGLWLANFLAGNTQSAWVPPEFTTKAKVHHFEADHPYNL